MMNLCFDLDRKSDVEKRKHAQTQSDIVFPISGQSRVCKHYNHLYSSTFSRAMYVGKDIVVCVLRYGEIVPWKPYSSKACNSTVL